MTSSKTNLYRRMAIFTNELMSWASTIVVKFLPYNKLWTHSAKKHGMQQTISAIFSMLWPSKELPQPPTMQSLTACVHFFAAVIFISLAVTDVVYTSVCCCFILLQRTGAFYQLHAQYSMYTNPSPPLSLLHLDFPRIIITLYTSKEKFSEKNDVEKIQFPLVFLLVERLSACSLNKIQ